MWSKNSSFNTPAKMAQPPVYDPASDGVELYFWQFVTAQYSHLCIFRYSSRELSHPLCIFLKTHTGPAEELHAACKRLIVRIVETHRMYMFINYGKHCTTKILHQLLLVAAKVAFSCNLPDTVTVSRLLAEIYRCDRTFRRLIIGAYYDSSCCYELAGIDSLFNSQEESLEAARYFLHHTNKAKKLFICKGIPKRMQDVPMQEEYCGHPAAFAVATDSSRMFTLLVEYGANLQDDRERPTTEEILDILQRVLPELCTNGANHCRDLFLKAHPIIVHQPPSLQVLSRLAIRKHLHKNFQLPGGIKDLPLPDCMKKYINLDMM